MRIRALPLMIVTAGLALAQTPAVSTGGVVNGASFVSGQPITGGALVSIFGSNFASAIARADSIPLFTSLRGLAGKVGNRKNSIPAPLLFRDSDQIHPHGPLGLSPTHSS